MMGQASTNSPLSCCEKGGPFLRQNSLLWCCKIESLSWWCSVLYFRCHNILVMWKMCLYMLDNYGDVVFLHMSICVLHTRETTSDYYQKLGCYWIECRRSCGCYCFCCCFCCCFCWNTIWEYSASLLLLVRYRVIVLIDNNNRLRTTSQAW